MVMVFTKGKSSVYHILQHPDSGSAPPPCGVRADRHDLKMFKEGRPTPNIAPEIPSDATLCKHCEAATRKENGGARI